MSQDNPFDAPPAPETPPPAPAPAAAATGPILNGTTSDDRTMALLAHILGIPCGFVGPLIIWLIKKDQSPFVNDQGKEALNFHITMFCASIFLIPVMFVFMIIPFFGCLAIPAVMALGVGAVVLQIMAAVKANEGVAYRYPFCIRLIK